MHFVNNRPYPPTSAERRPSMYAVLCLIRTGQAGHRRSGLIVAERGEERREYLSVGEVAAMLRISPQTIRLHIREDKLPAARFGLEWRVRRSDLEALFDR